MIGPRNSVVRELLGESVPLDELLRDQSPFINGDLLNRREILEHYPEFWIDKVRDHVGEELEDA